MARKEHRGNYTLHLSVEPYYATVELKGVTRKEAERYAREWAADPFDQVDIKEYVSWHIEEIKGPRPRKSKKGRYE